MMDLSVEIAGIKFRNPVMTAAGPPSMNGDALMMAARAGAGGLVTKTISTVPAKVPRPNMAVLDRGETDYRIRYAIGGRVISQQVLRVHIPRGMMNAELWTDLTYEQWIEKEIPKALSTGLPVIASIGYTAEDLRFLGPKIERTGVSGIEFSLHYVGIDYKPILEIAKALRESVDIPIFAKLSPHILNLEEFVRELERIGVDGIVAINSLGPGLTIDVETGKPILGGKMGYGWISGPAIRPLALRIVAEAARSVRIPIIGVGGVMSGRDAIEFFMAGASAVQICTGAILEGPGIYGRVVREIEQWLKQHGYDSVEDIKGIALRYLPEEPIYDVGYAIVDEGKCKACGFCEKVCRYDAIHVKDVGGYEVAVVDSNKCYGCGMCVSVCPERAISFSRRWI